MSAVVAAFDFDGTLTRRDTLPAFLRALGTGASAGALWPVASTVARRYRQGDRDGAKEVLFTAAFAGRSTEDLEAAAQRLADDLADGGYRPDVLRRLRAHQGAGDRVVVVSASPELWVAPAVARLGVTDVLATRLEVVDGRFTGRFDGRNCRGPEKAGRLEEWWAVEDMGSARLVGYGDSSGDAELLARADEAHFVGRRLDRRFRSAVAGRRRGASP